MATAKPLSQVTAFFPAYNEEQNIAQCIERARTALEKYAKEWEIIIIVYEGSLDRTKEIVQQYAKKDKRIRLIMQPKERKGVGAAYLIGFEHAKYSRVFYCDSDNQFDPEEIKRFLPYIDDYDIIASYRIDRQDPHGRIWASKLYNFFLRQLFPIKEKDVDCAFRMVNKRIFEKITIISTTGLMTAEMLAKARIAGYKITQVGVTHYPRTAGEARFETTIPAGLNFPKPTVVFEILCEIGKLRQEIHRYKKQYSYRGSSFKPHGTHIFFSSLWNTWRIFWNAVLFRRCPLCHSPIIEKDYPVDLTQYGRCTNHSCSWGKN